MSANHTRLEWVIDAPTMALWASVWVLTFWGQSIKFDRLLMFRACLHSISLSSPLSRLQCQWPNLLINTAVHPCKVNWITLCTEICTIDIARIYTLANQMHQFLLTESNYNCEDAQLLKNSVSKQPKLAVGFAQRKLVSIPWIINTSNSELSCTVINYWASLWAKYAKFNLHKNQHSQMHVIIFPFSVQGRITAD